MDHQQAETQQQGGERDKKMSRQLHAVTLNLSDSLNFPYLRPIDRIHP